MLLFNQICSIAQNLRLLYISLETVLKLNVHKVLSTFTVSSMSEACCMKIQNNVFGKSQDYNKAIPRQKNLDVLKVSWMKPSTKKLSFHTIAHSSSKYSKYWLLVRNVTRVILVTYSGHRFFLHLSCLKSLRVCIYCSHNKPFWSK